MHKDIETRVSAARTRLLLDQPWFGSLAMRLAIDQDASIPTFNVDGVTLKYNPTFAEPLSDAELTAVLAHEVMHCALLHPYRRSNRDAKLWNQATDYVINGELVKSGFKLPEGCLIDRQFDGLSSEVVYARLQKDQQPDQGDQGKDQGPGQPTGDVQDAPAESEDGQMTETDWKIATEQATAVCKGRGDTPAGIETAVKTARKDVEDWRSILREFVEHTVPSDYSWTSPNRRYIASGLYLPGVVKENLGHVVIAVDTSGSIDQSLLGTFAAELNGVISEAKPDKVTVMYCDSQVNRVEEFGQDEPVNMTAIGRGGTAFTPVFDAVSKWDTPPVCLIYFTDLDGDQPKEPEYPVLWCTSLAVTKNGPFGRTVRITEE